MPFHSGNRWNAIAYLALVAVPLAATPAARPGEAAATAAHSELEWE